MKPKKEEWEQVPFSKHLTQENGNVQILYDEMDYKKLQNTQ